MHPGFDLTGKVAVITGGNSGIGLGMAEGLAQAGATVAILGRNEARNAEAVARVGGGAFALSCDVADEAATEAAFAAIVDRCGRIDACFANAGVAGFAPSFTEMSTEEWHRVLRVNLDGAFYTLRAAARHMVAGQRGGSLAVTASLAAIEGQARGEHYAATKGGVIAMTKALAVELARHGIRANAILPGWIVSGMTEMLLELPQLQSKVLPRIPLRRWGTGADFAGIAVYLASDLSRYHTGDTFVIDGGYSIY